MELRHLRYFIAVAEESSFSRAAQRLHIAQPRLSQQIAALEGELGVQLFERNARGVTLTHAGEEFLKEARLAVAQAHHAVQIAQRAGRGEVGQIEIGFLTSATNVFFARIIRSFRARHPQVALALRDMCEADLLKRIRSGKLDLALMRNVPEDDEIKAEALWSDSMNIGLPADHPLAAQPRVALADLSGVPFIMLSPERYPLGHACVLTVCRDAGFIPLVAQNANDYQSMIWLVSTGAGVAIVSETLRDLQREGMVWRPLTGLTKDARMLMVWRRDNGSPVLRLFQDVARLELNLPHESPAQVPDDGKIVVLDAPPIARMKPKTRRAGGL